MQPQTRLADPFTIGGTVTTPNAGKRWTESIENPYALTLRPTTDHRSAAGIVPASASRFRSGSRGSSRILPPFRFKDARGRAFLLLTAAFAAAPLAVSSHAQQTPDPAPAPVVRIQRHPPAQTAPGTTPGAPGTAPNTAAGTAGQASPAAPVVVHHPRPVPSQVPGSTPSPTAAATPKPAKPAARSAETSSATATQGAADSQTHTATPSSPAAKSPTPAAGTPSTAAPSSADAAAKAAKSAPERPSNVIHGLNRNVIVLDPGHGGADLGAHIGDNTLEKNVTLALAFRLRSLLLARGFTVVMTRDSDAATMQTTPNATPTPLTLDDRAGIADHAHAAACLLLHATGRGTGLHLYNSAIEPTAAEPYLVPWLTGQAAWVPASRALEGQVSAALGRSGITMLASTASVRPVDSLTCPALVLELAPENRTPASINDPGYQERVAAALAGALVVWENAVQPPPRLPAPPHKTHRVESAETASPALDTPSAPEVQP